MSKWFGIAFLIIGIGIYRSFYEPTLLGSGIVAVIAAGIGGVAGEIYNRYLGKFDFNVIYFIDNILWLIVYCIPGSIIGYIISDSFGDSISGAIQTTIIVFVMLVVALPLTYRKLRSKQRKRMQQDLNDFLK